MTTFGEMPSVKSERSFGSIALAYLPRGAWDPGGEVRVAGRAATVSALPFG